jgi:hypothetical protein
MQEQLGMMEVANGNYAQGQRDLMMGQAREQQGQREVRAGHHNKHAGNHQMAQGQAEVNYALGY